MTVPDSLAYLEIVRQINGSTQVHLRASEKQSYLLGCLSFGVFIRRTTSYALLEGKIGYYQLSFSTPREKFDPEGYIQKAQNSQGLDKIEHIPLVNEDIIRNLEREESVRRKELYNKVANAYTWKMQQ